ncbi:MAG: exopolysaccharide biosynthesis polyprenyl glycosylphosphotransferase [Acidobacteria bacterium]|nr:exopolysaccharide biosynthesis polyprenyl glycosylphosphotransferase [Acidobacteriota bacterium]
MFDHHKQKAVLLFAAADVILTLLAFEAAYQTRALLPLPRTFFINAPLKALLLGVILALWLALGRSIGVYERLYGADTRAALYDTLRQVFFGVLGLTTFMFLLRLDISRPFIGLFLLYNLVLLATYRAAAGRLRGYIRKQFGAEVFCVVVGEGPQARDLSRQLAESQDLGVRLLALVDVSGPGGQTVEIGGQSYQVKRLDELAGLLRKHVVDEVFFAVDAAQISGLEEIFLLCDEEGVRTRVATHFFPHVNSRVFLDRFADQPLLTFSSTPQDEMRLLLKRAFDIVVSASALVVLALPMLLVALLVRWTSPGPALFRQERCGLNGRRFRLYKFRSMVMNAEALKEALRHLNEKKDGPAFKLTDDPRLSPIGRFLRRYSIDEWPQFWNVLRGDMSIVGPRPSILFEVEQYQTWQRRRLRMRPGLTCLWAVRGRDALDFETWMKMDLEYIDNWSLWLDVKILLQSIPLVVAGRGAH